MFSDQVLRDHFPISGQRRVRPDGLQGRQHHHLRRLLLLQHLEAVGHTRTWHRYHQPHQAQPHLLVSQLFFILLTQPILCLFKIQSNIGRFTMPSQNVYIYISALRLSPNLTGVTSSEILQIATFSILRRQHAPIAPTPFYDLFKNGHRTGQQCQQTP